ncbi:MAG: universal stress protein [Ferruginibacter sp.]
MLSYLFRNILLPVDFGENTEASIKQAIELAYGGASNIHLLHVIDQRKIRQECQREHKEFVRDLDKIEGVSKKLDECKNNIEETIPAIKVEIHIVEGDVYCEIIALAKKIQPQLIIICKKSNYKFFSIFRQLCPDELARKSCCPVLNVMNGSINSKIKIIVVPIRNFIPRKKIEFLVAFAKMFRSKIHLVALYNNPGEADSVKKALLDTYMILKNVLSNPIENHLSNTNNYPKTTLQFAESIGADMIFVNPQIETKVSSFTGKYINDILRPSSKLKILYLEPYPQSLTDKI